MTLSDLMNLFMLAHERGLDFDKTEILIRTDEGKRIDFTPLLLEAKDSSKNSSKLYLLPEGPIMEPDERFEEILRDLKKKAKRNQEAKARKLS